MCCNYFIIKPEEEIARRSHVTPQLSRWIIYGGGTHNLMPWMFIHNSIASFLPFQCHCGSTGRRHVAVPERCPSRWRRLQVRHSGEQPVHHDPLRSKWWVLLFFIHSVDRSWPGKVFDSLQDRSDPWRGVSLFECLSIVSTVKRGQEEEDSIELDGCLSPSWVGVGQAEELVNKLIMSLSPCQERKENCKWDECEVIS